MFFGINESNVNFTGGRPPQGVDPNTYAQQYANEKGITFEQAKTELKAKYGDPQQRGMSMNEGLPGLQFGGQGAPLGFNPYGGIPQDPAILEQFVENGARQAGCTPQEFARMLGIPPKKANNSTGETSQSVSSTTSATVNTTKSENSEKVENKIYTSFDAVKADAEKIYKSDIQYDTTYSERKKIRRLTNDYMNTIDTYTKEYIKEHKQDYKSAASKAEKKVAKAQVYKDAGQYALNKFREKYPDVDLSTVFYNAKENETGKVIFSHPNLKPYN